MPEVEQGAELVEALHRLHGGGGAGEHCERCDGQRLDAILPQAADRQRPGAFRQAFAARRHEQVVVGEGGRDAAEGSEEL